MKMIDEVGVLGQANLEDISTGFHDFIRGAVRHAICYAMAEEVEGLCGPKYKPEGFSNKRAGSAKGHCYYGAERMDVKRPRVRRPDVGKKAEINLESYKAARNTSEVKEAIMQAVMAGASSRDMKNIFPKSRKASKSEVSRIWVQSGGKYIEEMRSRDLSQYNFLVLMMDGIHISKTQTAVVAMGITSDGKKVILDFQVGTTENTEVCDDLLSRICLRGFKPKQPLLAILDGGKALKKSILKRWDNTVIQRCIVHKERNIKSYLSYKDFPEVNRLFARIRKAQGEKDGREALQELTKFVASKNAAALESLEEAGDELIALHLLGVPSTLNKSLLNTNSIENPFRNVRRKTGRVNRWDPKTDMVSRWLAFSLLHAEKGFQRISNYKDLDKLEEALKNWVNPLSCEG